MTESLFNFPVVQADSFPEWWTMYPRKVARKAAEKAYQRAVSEVGREVVHAGLIASLGALQAQHQRGFCPHPTTWLNQGRWDDEPADVAPATGGNGFFQIAAQGHVANVRGISA